MSVHYHVALPTFHPGQVAAWRLPGKRNLVRCGRRWGKTEFGVGLAVDGACKGYPIGWFAPDYKISSEAYDAILDPIEGSSPTIKRSSSKTEGRIKTKVGGGVDVWTLENERAGRSRKYKRVIIDEAAFTKAGANNVAGSMLSVWEKSIEPTLLDLDGECWVLSNTNGNDPENFLYAISPAGGDPPEGGYDASTYHLNPKPGKQHGFREFHAPSWTNPHVPQRKAGETEAQHAKRVVETFDRLRKEKHPLVFAQEYGAEFIDWSGVAFFSLEKLLVGGKPVALPKHCEAVLAVIDSATKTGKGNDGTAVVYYAYDRSLPIPLVVIGWDVIQMEGDLLITWLPTVLSNLEDYAAKVGARRGSLGAMIEDKDSGQILLQAATRRGFKVTAIPSTLTAMGKDERAIAVSGHVWQGKVKLSVEAYDRVTQFKGVSRNHLVSQVTGFRIGDKDAAKRADDLLDGFTYGVALTLGDSEGYG